MSNELHNRDLHAKDSHDLHSEDGRDLHNEDGICNAGSASAGDCLFTVRPEITFKDYLAANRLVNGRLILEAGLYLAALLLLLGGVLLLFHTKVPGLFLCAAAALFRPSYVLLYQHREILFYHQRTYLLQHSHRIVLVYYLRLLRGHIRDAGCDPSQ